MPTAFLHDRVDFGELLASQGDFGSGHRSENLVGVARASERDGDRLMGEYPGDGELHQGDAAPDRETAERFDHLEVSFAVFRSKERLPEDNAGAAPVVVVERCFTGVGASEQAMSERAIGHHANAELLADREGFVGPTAVEEAESDLAGDDGCGGGSFGNLAKLHADSDCRRRSALALPD